MVQKSNPQQVLSVLDKIEKTNAAGNITKEEHTRLMSNAEEVAKDIAYHDGFDSKGEEPPSTLSDSVWESWLFSHQGQY